MPTTGLRLHHYIIALVLVCFCAFPTRLSLAYCAFLLGMYIAGVGRWGFDGVIQNTAEIVGQGVYGTGLPSFLAPENFTAAALQVHWNDLPQQEAGEVAWDGFQLLVDDVLRYIGPATSYNLTSLLDVYAGSNTTAFPGGAASLADTIRSQPRECGPHARQSMPMTDSSLWCRLPAPRVLRLRPLWRLYTRRSGILQRHAHPRTERRDVNGLFRAGSSQRRERGRAHAKRLAAVVSEANMYRASDGRARTCEQGS